MRSGMDILAMNPQHRLLWLKANRVTLFLVSLVWIGIAVQQVIVGHTPWFMIAVIPIFASTRSGCYLVPRRPARRANG